MSTASKCSKCQKETTSTALDAGLCVDCSPALAASPTAALGASPEEDAVKMEIDTDLTTNETMDDIDDQEKSTAEVKEEQQQQQAQQIISKAKSEDEQVANKAATSMDVESEAEAKPTPTATPSPRVGKITRSSLNGQRSPTVMKRLRKSTRSTRFKAKLTGRGGNAAAGNAANGHNGQSTGGGATGSMAGNVAGGAGKAQNNARSRRTLFKRPAQKTPRMQAATRFVKSVFYKGSYMQIGDIVSIVDSEQKVYYAQIRGLLVDAYCEKSAFLTWLIPTQDSPDPKEGFDPATYLIGPDEQLSRKLCFLEFIMHAPSNYYFDRTTPFPLPDVDDYTTHRTGGFIWTRLPVVKREREREREKEREKERERKAAA
ncbi:uncharacterized protein LOC117572425 [Drosophila albomicans]|uniref:Uncharacterized protein LOC117572425 n=1 Tax=Drosophila albomicans TaxID=7291 RepID=A0A6P8XEL8_DROAB|nr:uncharacterized protein LOC117572425 [Drosophila albomicans]